MLADEVLWDGFLHASVALRPTVFGRTDLCIGLHTCAPTIEAEAGYARLAMESWVSLVACAGQLVLGAYALRSRAAGTIAIVLSLFCFVMFGWTFAGLAHEQTGGRFWHVIDRALSPWSVPLMLHRQIQQSTPSECLHDRGMHVAA